MTSAIACTPDGSLETGKNVPANRNMGVMTAFRVADVAPTLVAAAVVTVGAGQCAAGSEHARMTPLIAVEDVSVLA